MFSHIILLKIVEKLFTKLCKISRFVKNFLFQSSSAIAVLFVRGRNLRSGLSFHVCQRFSWNFMRSQDLKSLAVRQLVRYVATFRSSHRSCSVKKVFLKISQISLENTCVRVSFLIKLKAWRPECLQLYQKETPTQLFSCKICEIFKNNYFKEYLSMTASGIICSSVLSP